MGVRPNSPPQTTSVFSSMPALLEILDEGRRGLVGVMAVACELLHQAAVLVPRLVKQLDKPHAALDQPPCEQAIVGERGFARLGPVHFQNLFRLAVEIHQLRGAGLHAKGHLERVDPRGNLGVAHLSQPKLVERADGVERILLHAAVRAGRIRKVKHRVSRAAELHALINSRQESISPIRVPAAGAFCPELKTMKPGRSCDSLPSPYVTHAPMLGRPNSGEPVLIRIWPGAWLKASLTSDLTIASSSATSAKWGSTSESSAPLCPYRANLNRGPNRFEFGLIKAARYPLSSSAGGS